MYNIKNSKELASYINYTNLNNIITEDEIMEFLEKAKETTFNSVIVSPTYIELAKETLKDTDIKVGSVIGFPLGFEDSKTKLAEAKALLDKDVDELEVVINLSHLKDKKYDLIGKEIEEIKKIMGEKILKVNIEVKALEDSEKSAVVQVIEKAGADYVKNATGFVTPCHIYEIVNDINIIQKYAPKVKIEIYGGVDSYKIANQVLTAGADRIASNYGYEIVKRYKELRKNTQVKPKPITLTKK
ncbi:MAG: deoxyribose-phosphate aldolase [Methanobrevibacter sp.]